MRLGGPHNQSGRFGDEKNLSVLQLIGPQKKEFENYMFINKRQIYLYAV
jgi:hypothetical protein